MVLLPPENEPMLKLSSKYNRGAEIKCQKSMVLRFSPINMFKTDDLNSDLDLRSVIPFKKILQIPQINW